VVVYSRLSGPRGHPFHPILVTLPIGAFVSSLLFDVFTRTRSEGRAFLVDGAYWLIGIGLVGGLIAAVFGLIDLLTAARGTPAFATGVTHAVLNAVVLAVFAIAFAWRATDHLEHDRTPGGQIALTVVGVLILAVSGWLGGKLSYRYGIRVADHQLDAKDDRIT
jgi:uncharacterized membrane protein